MARLALEAEPPAEAGARVLREGHSAVLGGALVLHTDGSGLRVERLAVDPARVEESLLLVQTSGPAGGHRAPPVPGVAARVREALLAGRFDEVVPLWAEEWESEGEPSAEGARVAQVVREAGGGTRVCGGGASGLLAVWAPPGARGPGRREAVLAAAKAAGLRLFPVRVDLRGLDVE
jgi:hypothetical protein